MKHCPDCHAPNPARLTRCYACGVLLDAPPKVTVKPGESTYPCLNCDGAVPYSAKSCPHCGKVVEAPFQKPILAVAPPGWELLPLPDGTALLHRRGWGRVTRDFSVWGAGAVILYYLVSALALPLGIFTKNRGGPSGPWEAWIFLAPFAVLLLLWLAWVIAGREEIRVGRDWLEHRLGIGKWQRVKRITAGVVTVQSDWIGGRGENYYRHRLTASGRGGSVLLDAQTQSGFSMTLFDAPTPHVPSELQLMGDVVESYTGWNFLGPQRLGGM